MEVSSRPHRTSLLRRTPAAWRVSAQSVVIVPANNLDEARVLEGLAAAVWAMLEIPARLSELAEVLAAAMPHESDLDDSLQTAVDGLVSWGLLEINNPEAAAAP